jgi:hypothetical protein
MNLSDILSLPKIGSGNFRNVYRENNSVYKVEFGEGIDLESNRQEIANMDRLRTVRLPANVAIPEAGLMMVDGLPVVVMDYIAGELMGECFCIPGEAHLGCIPPGMERDLNALGIDVAYGNIILADSTYWLIDLDADLV